MAQLDNGRYGPGHWSMAGEGGCIDVDENDATSTALQCKSYKEHYELQVASLDALRATGHLWWSEVIGEWGNGFSYYYILSEEPLVLRRLTASGRYEAHPALIRGLTMEDIRETQQDSSRCPPALGQHP